MHNRTVMRKCPYCESTDIKRGINVVSRTGGLVGLEYGKGIVTLPTEQICADLCRNCGTVTRFYVKNSKRNWRTD